MWDNLNRDSAIVRFKISGMPKDSTYNGLPFGRRIEYAKTIDEFKRSARVVHLSQKRQSYKKAIREAIELYDVAEYYCRFHANAQCFDDSFEFFFKEK